MQIKLTIAMAAFNEEGCIEDSIKKALSALDKINAPGEVLVVDDGSTDRTPEIVSKFIKTDPRLRTFRHPENLGFAGFNRSMMREARGEWIFFISADGEFDYNEAVRFLETAEKEDLDAVLSDRTDKCYTLYRLAVSWAFNSLVRISFGADLKDIGSVRILRRSLYKDIPLYSKSAFINAERLVVGYRLGANHTHLTVKHSPRTSGKARGAKFKNVLASFVDLFKTRIRWFGFDRYYRK